MLCGTFLGLGKSPAVDSGFASNMSASKLATPTKSLFTSPNQEKSFVLTQNYYEEMQTRYPTIMEVRRRRRHFLSGQDDGKKRLFETSSQPGFDVFGVRYKLDEVIPWAVLGFVVICAIFTVTTLTSGLRSVFHQQRLSQNVIHMSQYRERGLLYTVCTLDIAQVVHTTYVL